MLKDYINTKCLKLAIMRQTMRDHKLTWNCWLEMLWL